jgi:hypothetical protein
VFFLKKIFFWKKNTRIAIGEENFRIGSMDSKVRGMDFEHMFVVEIVFPRSKKIQLWELCKSS